MNRSAILCLAVASGKGGVGKTFLSVNLATALAGFNRRVLLVDADLGLPNADIALGAAPELTLEDCLFGGAPLESIVVRTPVGIDLLAANSGTREMISLGEARLGQFVDELLRFASRYDVLLFDCASGINSSVTAFLAAAPQSVVVVQPEPSSLMDAYALMKVLHQDGVEGAVSLVMNGVRDEAGCERILAQLVAVTRRYLQCEPECLGRVPYSAEASRAMRVRQPLVRFAPEDPAADAIRTIARRILRKQKAETTLKRLNASGLLEGMLNRCRS